MSVCQLVLSVLWTSLHSWSDTLALQAATLAMCVVISGYAVVAHGLSDGVRAHGPEDDLAKEGPHTMTNLCMASPAHTH
eukprot:5926364-Amphidinium_carterae.1